MGTANVETRNHGEEIPIVSASHTLIIAENTNKSYRNSVAVYLILASVLFERIAFYSIAANLIVSSKNLLVEYHEILIAASIFTGNKHLKR